MLTLPVPRDRDGKILQVGSELSGDRITLTTASHALKFATDIKGGTLLVESGTLKIIGENAVAVHPFDAAAAVNSGGGLVSLTATNHGFTAGDSITIVGTTNYDGTYTVHANTTTNTIVITATYHAETLATTAYATGKRYPVLQQGSPMDFPVAKEALDTVMTLAATTGTCVVNILVWR